MVTFVLSLISGERPSPLQLAGICITLFGIILATVASTGIRQGGELGSENSTRSWFTSGIALALAAALLFGVSVWLMKFAALELGSQLTLFLLRQTALVLMVLIFLFTRRSPRLESWDSLRWIVPVAVLDTLATWFLNIGMQTGLASVVSVITSLYSVVTIILGYLILSERITRRQQFGIGFTLFGVVLASI
jgi:drug/metabolite transporter (DMT)-like permease